MLFKHPKDERDYCSQPAACNLVANVRLKELLNWIEQYTRLTGCGEVTITSYYRPDDADSYHSILQAADIRTKDKPQKWKEGMKLLSQAVAMHDQSLQIYLHPELTGTVQEHFHVAIKDEALKKKIN